MAITPYSFVMGILWSFISVSILICFSSRTKFICYYGVSSLFAILALSAFRILFPIDLPFAKVIRSERFYPQLLAFLNIPLLGFYWFTPAVLLVLIWIIGALILTLRFFRGQRKRKRILSTLSADNDARIIPITEKLSRVLKSKKRFSIVQSKLIKVPHVFGFRSPVIYLPAYEFSDAELTAVVAHEWMHCVRNDLYAKMVFQVICLIFWWNPAVYLMRSELEHAQEMRCDIAVSTLFSDIKRVDYFRAIKVVMEQNLLDSAEKKALSAYSIGFIYGDAKKFKKMSQRFDIISDYVPNKRGRFVVNTVSTAFAICTLLLSYLIIIQPWYDGQKAIADTDDFSYSESEVRVNEDGTYDLYIDGEYVGPIADEDAQFFLEWEKGDKLEGRILG